jgi:transcriptional regulator with XRE-family HTH domain
MTQEQLAEKLNVAGRTVSRWETGSNMPDLSIIVELADYYDVDIRELLNGERKSENMNEEAKELMDKVVDYTSKDKEIILEKTQKYSTIAVISFIAGIVLAVFDFSNKYRQITESLFMVALIMVIAIWLLCSGKSIEMRKDKTKAKRNIIILLAVLTCGVAFMLALVGIIPSLF